MVARTMEGFRRAKSREPSFPPYSSPDSTLLGFHGPGTEARTFRDIGPKLEVFGLQTDVLQLPDWILVRLGQASY